MYFSETNCVSFKTLAAVRHGVPTTRAFGNEDRSLICRLQTKHLFWFITSLVNIFFSLLPTPFRKKIIPDTLPGTCRRVNFETSRNSRVYAFVLATDDWISSTVVHSIFFFWNWSKTRYTIYNSNLQWRDRK